MLKRETDRIRSACSKTRRMALLAAWRSNWSVCNTSWLVTARRAARVATKNSAGQYTQSTHPVHHSIGGQAFNRHQRRMSRVRSGNSRRDDGSSDSQYANPSGSVMRPVMRLKAISGRRASRVNCARACRVTPVGLRQASMSYKSATRSEAVADGGEAARAALADRTARTLGRRAPQWSTAELSSRFGIRSPPPLRRLNRPRAAQQRITVAAPIAVRRSGSGR